jgi:nicotinic acid mononucleotide adenylyltransferase
MNGEYLWEELNLTQNFNYKDVDDVYRNINSKDERKKYVWSILRDKYYSEVYKKYKDIDLLIKAGFFQNDLNIDEVDIYNLNLLTTPVSKIIDNIKNQKAENPVALLTTGGFCPLHEGHIYMMNMAKQRLEENGYNVIGGYFSQSHEDYVSTKPYYNTNRYENFAQCQEYLKDSDWLMADPWESLYVKTSINFTEVIERLELYLRKYVDKNIKVAYVFGGDNVEFMYCFENQGIGVCIDRYGCNKRFENMKSIIKTGNTFFIENNSNSSKLLSREIRKNEEKLHNENYDGVYLIRN